MATLEKIKVNTDYHYVKGTAQRKWGFMGSEATIKHQNHSADTSYFLSWEAALKIYI